MTVIYIIIAALVLIGVVILALVKIYGRAKASEVRLDIAAEDQERRERDAAIAARPASKRPLDELFRK